MKKNIALILKTLPEKPGVYQHLDKTGKIIYIGKAKNLKKRVASYFQKEHESVRTRMLVKQIEDIKTIVVNTEFDALLLENNLIKKYQPKYNVMLKDDKSYPWICIKNERFPRVFSTRRVIKDGSEYFGPYASVKMVNALFYLIDEIYAVRLYKRDVGKSKSNHENYLGSLEHQIKSSKLPDKKEQTEEQYMSDINDIRNILKGNIRDSILKLKELMQHFAQELRFEEAQSIKEKLEILEKYQVKSTVVHPSITNVDVYSIISDESYAYVNFFNIVNGAIIRSHTTEIKKKLDETNADILEETIIEFRERFPSNAKEIYLPFELDLEIPGVRITVPLIGDKKRIVELSERNAKYHRIEKLKQTKIVDPDRHVRRIMAQMKTDLRMPVEPRHIEGFDNSNIQGTNPVSACVVFKNGKPSKKEYRIFHVKTVEGPDDYASMEEVIYRRYKRQLEEGEDLPQLIVIDGGKGQLGAALKSLDKLNLRGQISIIGIAKRLEEIYFPGDSIPLYLDKNSETLKVLQHVRNESHRFGITHHRKRRSNNSFGTALEEIPGVGKKTIQELLKKFKSVKRIKSATEEELITVVGKSRAHKIKTYFKEKG